MQKLSDSDRAKIKSSVQRAEQGTSGEIVPLIVPESYDFGWVALFWAFVGSQLGLFAAWYATHYTPQGWSLHLTEVMTWQTVGAVIGFFAGRLAFVQRWTVPGRWQAHAVHRQCLADFIGCGLHHTDDSTGVLIYISLRERRVEILADKGIHAHTPTDYWHDQVQKLVLGIQGKQSVATLCEVIETIGKKLEEKFPRRAGGKNEISDDVREGHQD